MAVIIYSPFGDRYMEVLLYKLKILYEKYFQNTYFKYCEILCEKYFQNIDIKYYDNTCFAANK